MKVPSLDGNGKPTATMSTVQVRFEVEALLGAATLTKRHVVKVAKGIALCTCKTRQYHLSACRQVALFIGHTSKGCLDAPDGTVLKSWSIQAPKKKLKKKNSVQEQQDGDEAAQGIGQRTKHKAMTPHAPQCNLSFSCTILNQRQTVARFVCFSFQRTVCQVRNLSSGAWEGDDVW
ncbi:hypothetical protein VFPPC_17500 [Pochonia chlamydosporia 170]|uniref:Uncharacterized protein n=1 Tax=Pochonia chlamydosporia 170 TaxID=1380566 RepID=A0A219ARD1_METCM|nr:hypothetical protein VFPPC_17500 [Pochonia chlamydosporia 170]OWT43337.1 hypothetical protein VFPPC_17500 [Pochonia chlamydosporia 170]